METLDPMVRAKAVAGVKRTLPGTSMGFVATDGATYGLTVGEMLGSGSYGCVFTGTLAGKGHKTRVAIKTSVSGTDALMDERDIYRSLGLHDQTHLAQYCRARGWAYMPLSMLVCALDMYVNAAIDVVLVTPLYTHSLWNVHEDTTGRLTMTREAIRDMGISITNALEYIHGHAGIVHGDQSYFVHRDVTSRNIMFDVHGRAYLIDMGSVLRYADAHHGAIVGAGMVYSRAHRRPVALAHVEGLDARTLYASRRTDMVTMLMNVIVSVDKKHGRRVWRLSREDTLYTASDDHDDTEQIYRQLSGLRIAVPECLATVFVMCWATMIYARIDYDYVRRMLGMLV
jgi:hypothetical protein